jgi:S1-C subfamily serine protease
MGPGDRHEDEPHDEHHDGPEPDLGDESDDDHAPSRAPVPDPLDRVWLHPTELSMLGSAFAPTVESSTDAGRHRSYPWLLPLLAGAAGALLTVAVLAVTGSFDRSTFPTNSPLSAGETSTGVGSVAETLTRLSPSVVAVVARDAQGTRRGSGVCVRHGTQLLTSTRVVGGATNVQVVTADGHQHTARVVGRDMVTDLVLLDLRDDADLPAAPLADKTPATGSSVWLLGAPTPGAKSPWMSGGMASSNDALVVSDLGPKTGGLLETDAATSAAAVGGALVDGTGSVAGIVLGHVNGSATTYAVSISVAVAVALQLEASGVAQHGTLGVIGKDTPLGPMIVTMPIGAPAARAGAKRGDLVSSINGRAVESIGDVTALVRGLDPGRTVAMELRRGTSTVELQVQLGAATG